MTAAAGPKSEKASGVVVVYLVDAHKRVKGQRKTVDEATAAELVRAGIVRYSAAKS